MKNDKLIKLAEKTKSQPVNLFTLFDKIKNFEKDDSEEIIFSEKADEGFLIVKADIARFSNIEDFILRVYIADDDLKFFHELKNQEKFDLACLGYFSESCKAIKLKKIEKYDIEKIFIKKVLQKIHINTNDINSIYWLEEDPLDDLHQGLIFVTNKYLYYVARLRG